MNLRQKLKAAHDAQLATAAAEAKVDVTGWKLKALAQIKPPRNDIDDYKLFYGVKGALATIKTAEMLMANSLKDWHECYHEIDDTGEMLLCNDDSGNFGYYGEINHADGRTTVAFYLTGNKKGK